MSLLIAIGFLVLWLILAPVVDKQIKKRSEKVKKARREDAIKLHERCDNLDREADRLAQELLKAMKAAESLPPEEQEKFMDKYTNLMFEVDRIKSDTKRTRAEFPLEEELVNV